MSVVIWAISLSLRPIPSATGSLLNLKKKCKKTYLGLVSRAPTLVLPISLSIFEIVIMVVVVTVVMVVVMVVVVVVVVVKAWCVNWRGLLLG